jgi:hypothetical protein
MAQNKIASSLIERYRNFLLQTRSPFINTHREEREGLFMSPLVWLVHQAELMEITGIQPSKKNKKIILNDFILSLISGIPELLGNSRKEKVLLRVRDKDTRVPKYESLFLCHALSPLTDSIALYCDLGRGFRLSKILGIGREVMLAGPSWSGYNWIVDELGLTVNLNRNQEWRHRLYKSLGYVVNDCDMPTLGSQVDEYVNYVNTFYGKKFTLGKLSKEDILEFKDILNKRRPWSDMRSIMRDASSVEGVVRCVFENFNRLDAITFSYFLAQYWHQVVYDGKLKLATMRERTFDESFILIDELDAGRFRHREWKEKSHENIDVIYFGDYAFGSDERGKAMSVHPYVFPSGRLYAISNKNIPQMASQCILADDYENTPKIIKVFHAMPQSMKPKIISDMLSFIHGVAQVTDDRKALSEVGRTMRDSSLGDSSKSWELWTSREMDLSWQEYLVQWLECIFVSDLELSKRIVTPFWIEPYTWSQDQIDLIGPKILEIGMRQAVLRNGLPALSKTTGTS